MKFSDLIIYTDVDGTAATHINYVGVISEANLQAIEEFVKEVIPFIISLLIALLIVTYIPKFTLLLPNLLY